MIQPTPELRKNHDSCYTTLIYGQDGLLYARQSKSPDFCQPTGHIEYISNLMQILFVHLVNALIDDVAYEERFRNLMIFFSNNS